MTNTNNRDSMVIDDFDLLNHPLHFLQLILNSETNFVMSFEDFLVITLSYTASDGIPETM